MNNEITKAILRVIPFVIVMLVFAILVWRGRLKKEDFAWVGPSSRPRVLYWVVGFIVLVCVEEWIVMRLGWLDVQPWNHTGAVSFIRIIGAVLLAPIAEELIFRGMFITKLSQRFSVHVAILIQAVVFVMLHSFTYENTTASNIGIIQGFTDAILYGYARWTTRTIMTSTLMHMGGNLIATLERFIV